MALRSKIRAIAGWALQILLAFAFVSIGLGKFNDAFWARSFERWGYPSGFHIVVGIIELVGGLTLLIPRLASYGALLLGGVMIAAAITHAMAGQPWTRPLPHLAMLMILAWVRWSSRVKRPVKFEVRSLKSEG